MNTLFTCVATAAVVAIGGVRMYVAEKRSLKLATENDDLRTKVEQLEDKLDVQTQINDDLRRHLPNVPGKIPVPRETQEEYDRQCRGRYVEHPATLRTLGMPPITEDDIARGDAYAGPGIRAMLVPRTSPPWGSVHYDH